MDDELGPDDALPRRPARVLVTGASGSGKTWLARDVARRLGTDHVEIDALFWGPGWTERPTFVDDVTALATRPGWVTEWQYCAVRELLAERADLVVWLDLPRWRVLGQVVRRTLSRRLRRTSLWNANVEPPLWRFMTDPEHIVRWSWTTHARVAPRVAELRRTRPDLPVVRLRSRQEVRRWSVGPLARAAAGAPDQT